MGVASIELQEAAGFSFLLCDHTHFHINNVLLASYILSSKGYEKMRDTTKTVKCYKTELMPEL